MSVDIFMKIAGAEGESADDKHKNEIDVLSWSWGGTQSGTMHVGTGGGSGKVSVHDLSFTKRTDSATHALWLALCNGKHFNEAKLTVRKAGENPLEYLKITLTNVLISSISTGGSKGDEQLTEQVTLNFSKFKIEYTPQTAQGAAGATKEAGYDIAANKKT